MTRIKRRQYGAQEKVAILRKHLLEGVAVSAGSACASGAVEPSPVLIAMGLPDWRIRSAFRVSLGPTTEPGDVDRFLEALGVVVARLSAGGSASDPHPTRDP